MVFFLYAVSGLLVLGGFGLALYGADNIRSDSGAVFAATGVSAAAAGLLLLAMTRVLTELRKIRVALEDGLARGAVVPAALERFVPTPEPEAAAPPPAASPPSRIEPPAPAMTGHQLDVDEMQRELDLAPPAGAMAASAAAAAGAAVAGGLAEQLLQRTRRRVEESAVDGSAPPAPSAAAETLPKPVDEDDDLLREPDTVLADAPFEPKPEHDFTEEAPIPDPAFAPIPGDEVQAVAEYESLLPAPPEATPEEPAAPPPRPAERTLAATYASGENTYFMYSDGTIEAETPIGRFRFVSMDELRNFVETGEGGIPLTPAAPPGAA